jgi:hypothetical protein
MQKFWTFKDGQIGSAHVGRDGSLKDFRAANFELSLSSRAEWENVVFSCKGIEIVPLILPIIEEILDFNPDSENDRVSGFLRVAGGVVEFERNRVTLNFPTWMQRRSKRQSPESIKAPQEWLVEKRQKDDIWEQERELELNLAEKFIQNFHLLSLTGQQRKWVKQFLSNSTKSRQEVEKMIDQMKTDESRCFLRHRKLDELRNHLLSSASP